MNLKDVKSFEELNLKQTLRAHILYEQIMGHPFIESDGLNGIVMLFYSYVIGSNRDTNIDYNDFLDFLDEHNNMIGEFTKWIIKMNDNNKLTEPEPEPGEAKEAEA